MAIFTDKTVGHGDGGEQYHKERRMLDKLTSLTRDLYRRLALRTEGEAKTLARSIAEGDG